MSVNYKAFSLFCSCILLVISTAGIAQTHKNNNIEQIATEFLANAPEQLGMPLYKYTQALQEKYKDTSTETFHAAYCHAIQIDPVKALNIMNVSTGGSADGMLPRCEELQLDYKLPEVAVWVDAMRKTSPEVKGSIRSAYIHTANMTLLAAAVAPDIITEAYARSQEQCDKFNKISTAVEPLANDAQKSIVSYYVEKCGFSEYKAKFLAAQHMQMITQANTSINFTVSR